MEYAPIAVFGFNRPKHLQALLQSLDNCPGYTSSPLFVFLDGSRSREDDNAVQMVRDVVKAHFLKHPHPDVKLILRENNMGLKRSIISSTEDILSEYQRVIVLEDDLVVAPDFLTYMNDCLAEYASEKRVWSVSGFSYALTTVQNSGHEVYFLPRASSWGWGTWKDRWDKVDWNVSGYKTMRNNPLLRHYFNRGGTDMSSMLDREMAGDIQSWAIRWCYAQFLDSSYTVYPTHTKILNTGNDGSGTNVKGGRHLDHSSERPEFSRTRCRPEPFWLDEAVIREARGHMKLGLASRISRFIRYRCG